MSTDRKLPPKLVQYRGANYHLVTEPAKVVRYRGAKYILADERTEQRAEIKEIDVEVPEIVYLLNYFPVVKHYMDQLSPRLIGEFGQAAKEAMWQYHNGLKLLIDAGYDDNLYKLLENTDYVVEVLDHFVSTFAKVDAHAAAIAAFVKELRDEVLNTWEFKQVLPDDTYEKVFNSELDKLSRYKGSVNYVSQIKTKAKKAEQKAKTELKDKTKKKVLLKQPQKEEMEA